jgi:hypothetical protein
MRLINTTTTSLVVEDTVEKQPAGESIRIRAPAAFIISIIADDANNRRRS